MGGQCIESLSEYTVSGEVIKEGGTSNALAEASEAVSGRGRRLRNHGFLSSTVS